MSFYIKENSRSKIFPERKSQRKETRTKKEMIERQNLFNRNINLRRSCIKAGIQYMITIVWILTSTSLQLLSPTTPVSGRQKTLLPVCPVGDSSDGSVPDGNSREEETNRTVEGGKKKRRDNSCLQQHNEAKMVKNLLPASLMDWPHAMRYTR